MPKTRLPGGSFFIWGGGAIVFIVCVRWGAGLEWRGKKLGRLMELCAFGGISPKGVGWPDMEFLCFCRRDFRWKEVLRMMDASIFSSELNTYGMTLYMQWLTTKQIIPKPSLYLLQL